VLVGERGEVVKDFAGLLFWRAALSAMAATSWDFESAFAICLFLSMVVVNFGLVTKVM
jgi:hypothetical protein